MLKLKTNKILIVGVLMYASIYLVAFFRESLGMEQQDAFYLAFAAMITFGVNISGVIIGFSELKISKKIASIGLLGNTALTVLFLGLSSYALMTM